MAKKTTAGRKRVGKRNMFDPLTLTSAIGTSRSLGKYLPSQSRVDRFVRGNPLERIRKGDFAGSRIYNSLKEAKRGLAFKNEQREADNRSPKEYKIIEIEHDVYGGIVGWAVVAPDDNYNLHLHRKNPADTWIVVSKSTGKPISEIWDSSKVAAIDRSKYDVYTAREWQAKYYAEQAKHNPAEDIELLNGLAPVPSLGHIEFTPDGIERFARDGYIYVAYSATPVMQDGYRVGTVEGVADESLQVGGVMERNPPRKCPRCGGKNGQHLNVPCDGCKRTGYVSRACIHCGGSGSQPCPLAKRNPGGDNFESFSMAYNDGLRFVPVLEANKVFFTYEPSIARGVVTFSVHQPDWLRVVGLMNGFEQRMNPSGKHPRGRWCRRNPASESDALYESFHGAPPSETLEIHETEYVHGHLASLGDLTEIVVKLSGGTKVGATTTLTAPDPETASDKDIVHVASNELGNQLYLVSGDQSVDVKKLGFRDSFDIKHDGETFEATELKDLMVLGEIQKLTYRTQKSFDDFSQVDYFHQLGEDTKVRPMLLYDTMNDRMKIAGGEYHVHSVGVVN